MVQIHQVEEYLGFQKASEYQAIVFGIQVNVMGSQSREYSDGLNMAVASPE